MKPRWYTTAASLTVVLAAACTGSEMPSADPATSAGETWRLGSRTLVVGGDDTLAGHDLFRVRTSLLLPDGRLVVADGGSNQVRVFDPSGQLAKAFGGRGGGPQEFGALYDVWLLPPDTLLTYDIGSQRFGYWSADGEFLRATPTPLGAAVNYVGRLGNGTFAGIARAGQISLAPGELGVDSTHIVLVAPGKEPVTPAGDLALQTRFAGPSPTGSGVVYQVMPLHPRLAIAVADARVYVGYGDAWSIAELDTTGQRIATIDLPAPRERFDDALHAQWLDAVASRGTPEQRPALLRFFQGFPTPDSLPTFDRFLADDRGNLWIRSFPPPGAESHRWRVVSQAGRWLGELTVPASTEIQQITNGYVVAHERNAVDVEQVVVYRLERGR